MSEEKNYSVHYLTNLHPWSSSKVLIQFFQWVATNKGIPLLINIKTSKLLPLLCVEASVVQKQQTTVGSHPSSSKRLGGTSISTPYSMIKWHEKTLWDPAAVCLKVHDRMPEGALCKPNLQTFATYSSFTRPAQKRHRRQFQRGGTVTPSARCRRSPAAGTPHIWPPAASPPAPRHCSKKLLPVTSCVPSHSGWKTKEGDLI